MMNWKVPIERCRTYGLIVDHTDKPWVACYHSSSLARFDPATETWKNFRVTDEEPTDIRRPGVDSKNMIWTANYGGPNREVDGRNKGGYLYRLDPETGETRQWSWVLNFPSPTMPGLIRMTTSGRIPTTIWSGLDQETETFTRYPLPTRTDSGQNGNYP